jgi:hypothetical protein
VLGEDGPARRELSCVALNSPVVTRLGRGPTGLGKAVDTHDGGTANVPCVAEKDAEQSVIHPAALYSNLKETCQFAVHGLPLPPSGE